MVNIPAFGILCSNINTNGNLPSSTRIQMTMATTKSVDGLRTVSVRGRVQSNPWKPSTQSHIYPPSSGSRSRHTPPLLQGCHSSHSLMLRQSP